jgi:hypothetical protein
MAAKIAFNFIVFQRFIKVSFHDSNFPLFQWGQSLLLSRRCAGGVFGLIPHRQGLGFEFGDERNNHAGKRSEWASLNNFVLFQTVDKLTGW